MSIKIKQYPYNHQNSDDKIIRNIGEIITSTIPLADTGLHLLDGSVLQGGGVYNAFVRHMAKMYETTPEIFCTQDEYDQSISNYGVCGKYVYNIEANTLRLPAVTGFLEGTAYFDRVGNIEPAGLPNVKGTLRWGGTGSLILADGVFEPGTLSGYGASHQGFAQDEARSINFSNALSSKIYKDNYNKVQPQSIKVIYYVVIANSTKTDIQVNIDNVITDLNSKADTDLSNVTRPYITETYKNGASWYRVWSDGWCEQGGHTTGINPVITFLKPYIDTNLFISAILIQATETAYTATCHIRVYSKTGMQLYTRNNGAGASVPAIWKVEGYIR